MSVRPSSLDLNQVEEVRKEKAYRRMTETSSRAFGISGRRFADFLLFGVTSTELAILLVLTPTFTITDWIYVLQHIVVLGIALTRRPPKSTGSLAIL